MIPSLTASFGWFFRKVLATLGRLYQGSALAAAMIVAWALA
jgi:hypothetical protein